MTSIGEPIWYFDGHKGQGPFQGTIVGHFNHFDLLHYIIEVNTPVDSYLIIRPGFLVSAEKPKSNRLRDMIGG